MSDNHGRDILGGMLRPKWLVILADRQRRWFFSINALSFTDAVHQCRLVIAVFQHVSDRHGNPPRLLGWCQFWLTKNEAGGGRFVVLQLH